MTGASHSPTQRALSIQWELFYPRYYDAPETFHGQKQREPF